MNSTFYDIPLVFFKLAVLKAFKLLLFFVLSMYLLYLMEKKINWLWNLNSVELLSKCNGNIVKWNYKKKLNSVAWVRRLSAKLMPKFCW
jgi:hypothetical protein